VKKVTKISEEGIGTSFQSIPFGEYQLAVFPEAT